MFSLKSNPEIETLLNDNSNELLKIVFHKWKMDVWEGYCTMGYQEYIDGFLNQDSITFDGVEIKFWDLDEPVEFNAEELHEEMCELLESGNADMKLL